MNTAKRNRSSSAATRWLIAAGLATSLMLPLTANANEGNGAMEILVSAAIAYVVVDAVGGFDNKDRHHRRYSKAGHRNGHHDRHYRSGGHDRRYWAGHDNRYAHKKHGKHHNKHRSAHQYRSDRHQSRGDDRRYRRQKAYH